MSKSRVLKKRVQMKSLFILVLVLSGTLLNATMYSPMVKQANGGKIIDIGVKSQLEVEDTVSKIWSQYQATYVLTNGIVQTSKRIFSSEETCITDEFSRSGCPLLAEECNATPEYVQGNSNLVNTSFDYPTTCPVGTSYNSTRQRCETAPICQAGSTFDDATSTCVGTGEGYNNYTIRHGQFCDGTAICKDGDLLWESCHSSWFSEPDYRGEVVVWGTWWSAREGTFPSCYKTVTVSVDASCPTVAPNFDSSSNQCFTATRCQTPSSTKISQTVCRQQYSYYQYSCPTSANEYGEYFDAPNDSGSNCYGNCPSGRAEDCICNNEQPPIDNCKRVSYSCPIDASLACVHNSSETINEKPLEIHTVLGTDLVYEAYGEYLTTSCGENCSNGMRDISGLDDYLCFQNGNSQTGCIRVDGCTFSGRIDSGQSNISTIITNGNSISAIDANGVIYDDGITSTCTLNGTVGYEGRTEPITTYIKSGDKIKFWGAYSNEGDLGFIEFVKEVAAEDVTTGYVLDENLPWQMQADGFNRIESYQNETYAFSTTEMTDTQCKQYASQYSFEIHPGFNGIPTGDTKPYEIIMNATGGYFNNNQVIVTKKVPSFCPTGYAFNNLTSKCDRTVEVYNNYTIRHGKFCDGTAICSNGNVTWETCHSEWYTNNNYRGTTIQYGSQQDFFPSCYKNAIETVETICPDNATEKIGNECSIPVVSTKKCVLIKYSDEAFDFSMAKKAVRDVDIDGTSFICSPLKCDSNNSCQYASCPSDLSGTVISDTRPKPQANDCLDQNCDAKLPYYEWCGVEAGCPSSVQGYLEIQNNCYKIECPEGGFDLKSGACFKWQCPEGYIENGGKCVKN